jgi:DNA-directed RNA polymerase specialized sigma24 family protein
VLGYEPKRRPIHAAAFEPVIELSDAALHALLDEDPARGWRAFVEQYTSTLLALIERAGVEDGDDRTEVYVRICERLAERGCERLRHYDPSKGALTAWLTVVVRHAVVDWVRSRAGRRRLFEGIERLDEFDRRVFELFYWDRHRVVEIAGLLGQSRSQAVSMADVFEALARIEQALSDRQRDALLAATVRNARAVSLDANRDVPPVTPADQRPDPEAALHAKNLDRLLSSALGALPPQDAAIIRMVFMHGWALAEVQRALHLTRLTREHLGGILSRLRAALEARGVKLEEATTSGLAFWEDEPT